MIRIRLTATNKVTTICLEDLEREVPRSLGGFAQERDHAKDRTKLSEASHEGSRGLARKYDELLAGGSDQDVHPWQ
jgi:hypothetical protein